MSIKFEEVRAEDSEFARFFNVAYEKISLDEIQKVIDKIEHKVLYVNLSILVGEMHVPNGTHILRIKVIDHEHDVNYYFSSHNELYAFLSGLCVAFGLD